MKFNKFILENNDELINLTTKVCLKKTSSVDEFRENYFLDGQEKHAIEHYLFNKKASGFAITLIPSWECNLRCHHCFVLHELKNKDDKILDKNLLIEFIKKLVEKYPTMKTGNINFIGGEPTLRSKENLEIITALRMVFKNTNFRMTFTASTNAYECDETAIEFLSNLECIQISIDATKEYHDKQRKQLEKNDSISPFESSILTIKKLVANGQRDKIIVQGALSEEGMNKENLLEMYKILLMSGVKFKKIKAGITTPTKSNPKLDELFINVMNKQVRIRPCCKYRFMSNFVIDNSNRIFSDYFDADKDNFIGFLSDSIDEVAKNFEENVRRTMPVLNDSKCMSCPVIGACWGWCANTKTLVPSDHCDPHGISKRVQESAKKGNLKEYLRIC